jgi:hypothetical protein
MYSIRQLVIFTEILELTGNILYSELHFYASNPEQPLAFTKSMAWLTGELFFDSILPSLPPFSLLGQGIYHGSVNFESTTEDFIDAAQLLPYPPPSEVAPLSIALTEFHFILLYKDRIAAICNLNEQQTYEDPLPLVCIIITCFKLRYTNTTP